MLHCRTRVKRRLLLAIIRTRSEKEDNQSAKSYSRSSGFGGDSFVTVNTRVFQGFVGSPAGCLFVARVFVKSSSIFIEICICSKGNMPRATETLRLEFRGLQRCVAAVDELEA